MRNRITQILHILMWLVLFVFAASAQITVHPLIGREAAEHRNFPFLGNISGDAESGDMFLGRTTDIPGVGSFLIDTDPQLAIETDSLIGTAVAAIHAGPTGVLGPMYVGFRSDGTVDAPTIVGNQFYGLSIVSYLQATNWYLASAAIALGSDPVNTNISDTSMPGAIYFETVEAGGTIKTVKGWMQHNGSLNIRPTTSRSFNNLFDLEAGRASKGFHVDAEAEAGVGMFEGDGGGWLYLTDTDGGVDTKMFAMTSFGNRFTLHEVSDAGVNTPIMSHSSDATRFEAPNGDVFVEENLGVTLDLDVDEDITTRGADKTIVISGTTLTPSLATRSSDIFGTNHVLSHAGNISAFAPFTCFGRSGGTFASPTIVQTGYTLGLIQAAGHDGTDFESAADIRFSVASFTTPGNNDIPGQMSFRTRRVGGVLPVAAVIIDETQSVEIIGDLISRAGRVEEWASTAVSITLDETFHHVTITAVSTITLPNATPGRRLGRVFEIKRRYTGAISVVDANGSTLDGAATVNLLNGDNIKVLWTGAEWEVK